MTTDQGKKETKYLLIRCTLQFLLREGIISTQEYCQKIQSAAMENGSMIGELEVNSHAREANHGN